MFVQLVIAAMTTSPCVSSISCGAALPLAAAGKSVRVLTLPGLKSGKLAAYDALTFDSSTRSCGRFGPGERGLDRGEIELDDVGVVRRHPGRPPQALLLRVLLDEVDVRLAATGEAKVLERLIVDGEEAHRRAVFGSHVGDRGAVGERDVGETVAEELDELFDDAPLAEDLGDAEHEVGRGRALAKGPGQLHADDFGRDDVDRLAEHARLGLDAADAPADDAQAVDHRRVAVGADERIGIDDAVLLPDDFREVFEVHLVDDPPARRDDAEVVERVLAPLQELVAFDVPAELQLGVVQQRERVGVLVDLHAVVDHEVDGDEGVDLLRVPAVPLHRVAHRGQVHTTHGTPVKS